MTLEVSVKYEFHLRYQSCAPDGLYHTESFGGDTRVLLDCDNEVLPHHTDRFKDMRAQGIRVGIDSHDPPILPNILTYDY